MDKEQAIKELDKYSRASIKVEFAKEITEAFGCKLSDKLIRKPGTVGYREIKYNLAVCDVVVSDMAIDICRQLKLKPDLTTANKMIGIGSYSDCAVEACIKVLRGER